jgi:nitrile hydratase
MGIERDIANMPGEVALPRKNGELVFHEPWESRAFGMTVVLHGRAVYPWDAFRDRLIAEISSADGRSGPTPEYYEHWLTAFEKLLLKKGVITREELAKRTAEILSGERDDVF